MPAEAAVAIWCDVAAEARDEFNDWHAHEHMPERLSIPGFLRGSRWVGADAASGYCMLYEAQSEAAITGGPYLARLNDPSPWSRKMMPHHRNMVRSLCRVDAAFGAGLGQALVTVRLSPNPAHASKLKDWLIREQLAGMPSRKGLVAAQLLRNIARPQETRTTEQEIRGGDAAADWIVLVNGYSVDAVASVAAQINEAVLIDRGALPGAIAGVYRLAHTLAAADLGRSAG